MKHTYLFTRQEGLEGVTAAAVMTLETDPPANTHEEAFKLFEEAVTRWLNDTEAGKSEEYADDFNIADFLMSSARRSWEFILVSKKLGFRILEADTIAWDHQLSYDRVLNQERSDD